MALRRITNLDTTDMTNQVEDYTIDNASMESGQILTKDWQTVLSYYQKIPELQGIIDKKGMWTVGKGYKAKDERSKKILENIKGDGKDNINSMMYNMVKTYTICGDYFAEIVKVGGKIVNLKNIQVDTMRVYVDKSGEITKYEQYNPQTQEKVQEFAPESIFHLSWNRQGNNHLGSGTITKLIANGVEEGVLEMLQEAKRDLRIVFHRYVKPLLISKVETDDATEIATYKAKLDSAIKYGENLIIPAGTVDTIERVSIPQYSTLDPLPWINFLESLVIQAEGVPGVVLGSSHDTTEATAKIVYLAFQQMVEWNQLFLETNFKKQLDIEIELEFPASLEMSDTPKANSPQKDNQKAKKTNNMEMSPNTSVK